MKPSLSKCSFAIIFTLIGLGLFSATGQAQTYVFNQASFGVGNQPEAMAVGDFNGDGKPDFAVANEMDNTVSILLENPTAPSQRWLITPWEILRTALSPWT